MNYLRVLLVEDEPNVCESFINLFENIDEMELVDVTNNATKAIQNIEYYLPDAVILDLELHQGGGNGLDILKALNEKPLSVLPYILVTTNNTSSLTYEYARQLGADFIMSKHQDSYTEKTALEFLLMMKTVIQNKRKTYSSSQIFKDSPELHQKRFNQKIINELNLIGISPKSVGYKYLIDAIYIAIEKPIPNISLKVAQKYHKTESSVERAMQNAINRAWRNSDINDLFKYYKAKVDTEKGSPTLLEFIYYYANKIKNEY